MYAQDYDELLPAQPMVVGDDSAGQAIRAVGGTVLNYYDSTLPYVKSGAVWLCPSTEKNPGDPVQPPGRFMAYHMNGLLITERGLVLAAITEPARTLLLSEGGNRRRWNSTYLRPSQLGNYGFDLPISNHLGGANVAHADGHVKWYHDSQWNARNLREAP
jgi:prepilin-type processing-associated H-X9-DG protein